MEHAGLEWEHISEVFPPGSVEDLDYRKKVTDAVIEAVLRKISKPFTIAYHEYDSATLRGFIVARTLGKAPIGNYDRTRSNDKAKLIDRLERMDKKATFRFMDLPPELRHVVYDYVLVASLPLSRPDQPPITRTCRTIREESIPLFYRLNRFVITVNSIITPPYSGKGSRTATYNWRTLDKKDEAWVKSQSKEALVNVKALELHWTEEIHHPRSGGRLLRIDKDVWSMFLDTDMDSPWMEDSISIKNLNQDDNWRDRPLEYRDFINDDSDWSSYDDRLHLSTLQPELKQVIPTLLSSEELEKTAYGQERQKMTRKQLADELITMLKLYSQYCAREMDEFKEKVYEAQKSMKLD